MGVNIPLRLFHFSAMNKYLFQRSFFNCWSQFQVDKLDASESLRKEEEQATETQPIVYGNALVHVLSVTHFTFKTTLL